MDDEYYYYGWKPYVSAAARRLKTARAVARFTKKGRTLRPAVEGRRLPGRSGARRGATTSSATATSRTAFRADGPTSATARSWIYRSRPARETALVSGSDIYTVQGPVTVPKTRWSAVCTDCAGEIDSLIELLQGRLSKGVMARICQEKTGLFPSPAEISFCCPDWASMCKHVAAVLYGIGARLDEQPDLLFALRKVDQQDLIADGGQSLPGSRKTGGRESARHRRSVRDLRHRHRTGHASHAARHAGSRRDSTSRPPDAGVSHETASARSEPTPVTKPAAKAFAWSGNRAAVSKRMKEYWAARRRAKG